MNIKLEIIPKYRIAYMRNICSKVYCVNDEVRGYEISI
ncbi:hypothetical protein SRRS_32620 [Sporomusa rhizae]